MFPVIQGGEFIGCIGANVTLGLLSRFLERHRVSLNSITVIADRTDGQIIAYPEKGKEVRTIRRHLKVATLSTIADAKVRAAYHDYIQTGKDSFVFKSPGDGA
jgi:hypothetical protein